MCELCNQQAFELSAEVLEEIKAMSAAAGVQRSALAQLASQASAQQRARLARFAFLRRTCIIVVFVSLMSLLWAGSMTNLRSKLSVPGG